MSNFSFRLAAFCLLAPLGTCWSADPDDLPPSPTELRLAIVNSYGHDIMKEYFSESIHAMQLKISPVKLTVTEYGPDSFLRAAHDGAFDISIASSGLTSLMIEHTGGLPLMAVTTREAPDPNHANGATIIVRADRQDLKTIKDLHGKKLAIMSRNAFAGWQIPASELIHKGIDPERFFGSIRVVGYPMTKIVDLVQSGVVDVGFVASCLLERHAAAGEIQLSDFRVINEHKDRTLACKHSTELYPSWFFSVKPTVPTSIAKNLTATLLNLPVGNDGSQWTIPTDHRRLYNVFKIMQVPYGDPHDIWWHMRELRPYLLGVSLFILLALLNTVLLVRLARRRTRQLEETMQAKMEVELKARHNALQVEHLTRASAVGLLSSMVAHELKQPLTVITNYCGSLRRRLNRGDVAKETLLSSITEIEDSGTRAAEIIDRVRNYGHLRQRQFEPIHFSGLIHKVVAHWRRHSSTPVPLRLAIKPAVYIEADPLEMELVVQNLIKNAAAAVAKENYPHIDLTLHTDGGYAYLRVEDNGPALSDEAFERIGQIGYTTKQSGLGLGLPIVHSLVEAHGGSLTIKRRTDLDGRGLLCTVKLPTIVKPDNMPEDESQDDTGEDASLER